jgi:hypothetical protein
MRRVQLGWLPGSTLSNKQGKLIKIINAMEIRSSGMQSARADAANSARYSAMVRLSPIDPSHESSPPQGED